MEGEFAGRLRLAPRAFVLVPEERGDRIFREYHRAHRHAAATQDEDAPRFRIPEAGDPYPRSSFPALQAGAWVREACPTRFRAFDAALFEAFFGRCEDIGDPGVLAGLATRCGLDADALHAVLRDGRYRERVVAESQEARRLSITAIPAVVLPGRPPIVGAVPYAELHRTVTSVLQGEAR